MQTRNNVDDLGNDGRHDERVRGGGDNIGDLDVQKLPVMVEPAASDASVNTIQTDNVIGSEEGVEEQPDDSADAVFSPHVERVIDSNQELNLGSKIAAYAGDNTQDNAGPGRDKSGGRRGGDKSRDSARAPADEGPLLGEAVIEEAPSHGRKHGSQARVPAGHGSAEVGAKGRATVESQPAEPEEDGAEGDEGDVVGAEVEHHLLVTSTEYPGVCQSRSSRSDFDRSTTGIVQDAVFEGPSVGIPRPAGQGAVDESRPEECKDHAGDNATTLSCSANNESCRDTAELHLEEKPLVSFLILLLRLQEAIGGWKRVGRILTW